MYGSQSEEPRTRQLGEASREPDLEQQLPRSCSASCCFQVKFSLSSSDSSCFPLFLVKILPAVFRDNIGGFSEVFKILFGEIYSGSSLMVIWLIFFRFFS